MGEIAGYGEFVIDAKVTEVVEERVGFGFLISGTMEIEIEGIWAYGELGEVVGCDHGVYENQDLRGNLR